MQRLKRLALSLSLAAMVLPYSAIASTEAHKISTQAGAKVYQGMNSIAETSRNMQARVVLVDASKPVGEDENQGEIQEEE